MTVARVFLLAGVVVLAACASDSGGGAKVSLQLERDVTRTFRGQIFDGDLSLASDPCVLHDGATWRMLYTCVAGATSGGFCEVTSSDGVAWTPVVTDLATTRGIEGLVAIGRDGEWDENIETCSLVRTVTGYSLFYSGYRNLDADGNRPPAALGEMTSTDGVVFTRASTTPVLSPTAGARDGDDLFSAVAVRDGDALDFLYVGWCVDLPGGYHDGVDCTNGTAIQILGARRDASGVFTKRPEPVLTPRSNPVALQDGVAEPDVVALPDGRWLLLVTGSLGEGQARTTTLAYGPTKFGPWELDDRPALVGGKGDPDQCGAFAPSAIVDGDRLRVWYLALGACPDGKCQTCDATGTCTCDPRFSIGYAEAALP